MSDESKIKETADRIVELGSEVEAPGLAAINEPSLVVAREVLQQWISEMKGVVVNPAMGRVTIIDATGRPSSIASGDLAFRLCAAGITDSA
ncbi:MAG: hypothetical protein ABW321_02575 [Polyangiales bacterium]